MEKIAVRFTNINELKLIKEKMGLDFRGSTIGMMKYLSDGRAGGIYLDKSWRWDMESDCIRNGYSIQSAEQYLKGGGDVFKIGDKFRYKNGKADIVIVKIVGDDIYTHWYYDTGANYYDQRYDTEDLVNLTDLSTKATKKTKPTKKENEMKRVSVLLINKDTDAVIFNEEMATEFSDADLKVLILLDKSAEIKKSLGKEINVTLLHWEIKTITSYDKPEVK